MKVTFYGTRGSISVPEKNFSEFGGNTACLLLRFENGRIAILDAGTGLRKLGNDLLAQSIEQYDNIFIGLSHTHWDHIQGFPFFKPAYDTRRHFTIAMYGRSRGAISLAGAFETQMQQDYLPVALEKMGASVMFWQPKVPRFTATSDIQVFASEHNHPGRAYGYRITERASTLVYCTDVEYVDGKIDPNVITLARDADLLIHDAQYTPEELPQKKGWGHSSWEQAVEVAKLAGVKRLALFHHDPDHDDAFLLRLEQECRQRFPNSFFAREGMEISL
ncbi:MAG: MBL fold metallo-hydrolase [Proteobacteria bacterium]|nr:MBL fold metallo-hydrolase [Pseudomonadota bacterium]MBU1569695.1 MBL fold metallo-hydrolase [Pseudomonadota bacterium]